MPSLKRHLVIATALFVFSLTLFSINLDQPRHLNFDETAYVPVARQFLQMKRLANLEHPPLAKELMSLGIAIWGDGPFGWRFTSAVFGAVTLVAMYVWAFAIFGDMVLAVWVSLLTLANQLLYVMSRIALLDGFMFTFIAIGMSAFTFWWKGGEWARRHSRTLLLITGVALGLATACKWFGPIPLVLCISMLYFRRDRVSLKEAALCLGILPVAIYFLTFLPFLFLHDQHYGIWDILRLQARMWRDNANLSQTHSYMSHWSGWAIMKRPIWFAYDPEPGQSGFVRNVDFLANPLIAWGGLLVVPYVLWMAVARRRIEAILCATFYLVFYLSWALIPRRISFYYYYYPAMMTLSFVLAFTFQSLPMNRKYRDYCQWGFLAASVLLFIYFFPVLSAIKVPISTEVSRMWFRSWI